MSGSGKRHGRLFGALLAIGATLALVTGVFAGAGTAAGTAAPQNTSPPAISGTPQDGQTLSGEKGTWSGTPTGYTYFWMRCNKTGGSCSDISGASTPTYTLGSADVGNTLRFRVRATNADGTSSATSVPSAVITAAAKPAPPANAVPPTISGSPQEGSTLTAGLGSWNGRGVTYAYQWRRCNKNGSSCGSISGATNKTYLLTSVDVGNTLRIRVTGTNSAGSTQATSIPTAVVIASPPPPPPAGSTILVDKVSLPDRLVVDKLSFSPNPTRSRGPIVARFHVSDTRGYSIQGALVYALGLPYGWLRSAAEVPSDSTGWATITLQPTTAMPLHRGGSLVIFVRARKPGDNLLAGVSTRRLVQEGISR